MTDGIVPLDDKVYLATLIEQRILSEQRKHKNLDWVRIASDKIASEVVGWHKKGNTESVEGLKKCFMPHIQITYIKNRMEL